MPFGGIYTPIRRDFLWFTTMEQGELETISIGGVYNEKV